MTLQEMLDQIAAGRLLPAEMFVRDDLDEILDRRDEEQFEKPWLACSERITKAWEQSDRSAGAQETMDEIRKQSFLVVSRATRQHEMASYVSDDFELISKSIALALHDAYAAELLDTYRRGEIPGAAPGHATDR